MTNEKQKLRGTIQKVIHVELSRDQPGVTLRSEEPCRGYGLVRGEDGQEVFFIDSVVRETTFADLRVGQKVDFQIEEGPLMLAAYVTIPADENPCSDQNTI